YPGERRAPVEAHADERVAAQRRARVGADEGRRHPTAGPDPDRRARLLPGAEVPELRQSVAARHRLARGEGSVRRETRRRPRRRGVYLDFADAIARLGKPAIREKYGNLF